MQKYLKRFLVQYQSCECKCTLSKSLCNSKKKWNNDECWCLCKELDDWGSCKDDYMLNPGSEILNVTRHVKLINI